MDIYEEFSLGMYLSDWPENVSFDEIITAMRNEDSMDGEIGAWEPFEFHELSWLAEHIVSHHDSLKCSFISKKELKMISECCGAKLFVVGGRQRIDITDIDAIMKIERGKTCYYECDQCKKACNPRQYDDK